MRHSAVPHPFPRLLVLGVVLTASGVLLSGCTLFDRHKQLTIEMLMEDEGYANDVTTNAVEITGDVCNVNLKCVEAYSTDEANYYRFDSREAASNFADSTDDGFVVHYIAMDFSNKEGASRENQQLAMERLAGTWQDYDGPLPDRS